MPLLFCLLLLGGQSSFASAKKHITLFRAAQKGYVKQVRAEISRHPSQINSQGSRGYTALHWAALRGHTKVVRLLLEAGADQNIRNTRKSTPLLLAAWKGNIETVVELLGSAKSKPDIDAQNEGGLSPLMWAAREGWQNVVEVLLHAGADPLAQGRNNKELSYNAIEYARESKAKTKATVESLLTRERDVSPEVISALDAVRGRWQLCADDDQMCSGKAVGSSTDAQNDHTSSPPSPGAIAAGGSTVTKMDL